MKKLFTKFLAIFLLFLSLTFLIKSQEIYAQEKNPLDVYFFYGEGCPHCGKEEEFFKSIEEEFKGEIIIHSYEVYYNQENAELFQQVIKKFDVDIAGVPFSVIGDKYFIGYGDIETTGQEIKQQINYCLENHCSDKISNLIKESSSIDSEIFSSEEKNEETKTSPLSLNTRLFGKVDLKSLSIPIATILIAFVDGFNPCAMWILIFLITMLINMKDKKKLYILGTVFIATSGFVYFLFLAAWFNLFKFIGYAYWIKVVIGVVAIISGFLHVKDALKSKNTCKVTNQKQRESIMDKVKKTLVKKSFILSILGIMALAVSVNLIEVVCSAGLPAVYTNLLAGIHLNHLQYYSYLSLYVLIFILDDLFVFFIAVKTFEVTGITQKYTKWSALIGGAIIFIIGILLIVKPELLMFG